MYMKRGSSFCLNQSKQEFSQKMPNKKTDFLADTNLDELSSEQAGTPNSKSINILKGSNENLGHYGQNELWASLLA